MGQPTLADVPRLLEELRGLMQSKLRRPIDPDLDFLTDQIEVASMVQAVPVLGDCEVPDEWTPYGLSHKEHALAVAMKKRFGKTVYSYALVDELYPEGAERLKSEDILKVWICKLRQRIRNSPYAIETIWSKGYRMVDRHSADIGRTTTRSHWRDGIELAPRQFQLANALFQANGGWVSGRELSGFSSQAVNLLRARLKGSRYSIESERGFGFRMIVQEHAQRAA